MSFFGSNHFESNYFASNFFPGANVDIGGGGPSSKKKKRGHGREMAILETSLKEAFAPEAPQRDPVVAPAKEHTYEEVGGAELLREAQELKASIQIQKEALDAHLISEAEYQEAIRKENEALEVIIMALELDRHVLFSII